MLSLKEIECCTFSDCGVNLISETLTYVLLCPPTGAAAYLIEGWVVWAQVCNEGMWQTSHSRTPPLPQWLQRSSLLQQWVAWCANGL